MLDQIRDGTRMLWRAFTVSRPRSDYAPLTWFPVWLVVVPYALHAGLFFVSAELSILMGTWVVWLFFGPVSAAFSTILALFVYPIMALARRRFSAALYVSTVLFLDLAGWTLFAIAFRYGDTTGGAFSHGFQWLTKGQLTIAGWLYELLPNATHCALIGVSLSVYFARRDRRRDEWERTRDAT